LTRYCIAYEYTDAEGKLAGVAEEMSSLEESLQGIIDSKEQAEEQVVQAEARIQQLKDEKAEHMTGVVKETETHVAALSKAVVKKHSELTHAKDSLSAEMKSKETLTKTADQSRKAIEKKRKDHAEGLAGLVKHEEAYREAAQEVTDTEHKFAAMSAGASADGASTKSVAEELSDCKREETEASTITKQAELKLKDLKQRKKEVSSQMSKVSKDNVSEQKQVEALQKELKALEGKLAKMPGDTDLEQVMARKSTAEADVTRQSEQVDMLEARLSGLEFPYEDPESGFDRSRVKGRVAMLTHCKDPSATTAIEVTAGGKLFQVVVDSESTGKKLLQKGKLKHRVTLIPLNQIDDRVLAKDRLRAAQQAAGGADQCSLALDKVEYNPEVEAAMKYVFGNTVICNNSDSARRATFDAKACVKSVTLDGDIFDPSGTLTGGSRHNQSDSVLARLVALNEARIALSAAQEELAEVSRDFGCAAEKKKVQQQVQLKAEQVQLLEQQMAATTYGKLVEQMQAIETETELETQNITTAKETAQRAKKRISELEAEMKDSSGRREKALKAMDKELAKKKSERDRLKVVLREQGQSVEVTALEIDEQERELVALEQQIGAADEPIKEAQAEYDRLVEEHAEANAEYEEAQEKLNEIRDRLASCDENISNAIKEKNNLARAVTDAGVERKKIEHKIQRHQKDNEQAKEKIDQLLESHPWIVKEQKFFGRPHTDYDFESRDVGECQQRLNSLHEDQSKLSKNINKKVMGMYEKAEQEYQELMNKKQIIEKDKRKIEDVIAELDQKKSEAVQKTWEKVNHDFGSIFSTLLPGTKAKLEPPEGKSVLDGLEVRVAFRGVWKQSLQELSGGQRSLLALSLVLAMLRFKPAPMYILDEVDAALDMSHTQNIGQMLKKHFSQSQFIVVSLKDGMFNNANVLFKTKFVDGLSTVMRTTNPQ